MTDIPFGAVVLTDFPFTDLSAAKRRPALVASTDNHRRTDIVVAYITSAPVAELADAAALATLDIRILAGRRGSVDPAWLAQHRDESFAVFGFSTPGTRLLRRFFQGLHA